MNFLKKNIFIDEELFVFNEKKKHNQISPRFFITFVMKIKKKLPTELVPISSPPTVRAQIVRHSTSLMFSS